MPTITYIEFNGTEHRVDAQDGQSLMEAAVANMIPGILGDCGGNCSCATCHAYMDPAWAAALPAIADEEQGMLEGALAVNEHSRLCCQVIVTPALNGLVVRLPERQF